MDKPEITVHTSKNENGNTVFHASMPLPDWVTEINEPAFRVAARASLQERLDAMVRDSIIKQFGLPADLL